MPKSILFFALFVASAILNLSAQAAAPSTVFSDLNGTAAPGGYVVGQYSPGVTFVIGAAFTPVGQSYALNRVQALLSFNSGENYMVVGLYEDSGGVPGRLLESWNLDNTLSASPSIMTMNSVLQPTLRAGRRYWITAGMADATSVGVWWINNIGGACCGSPDQVQGFTTASLNGGPFRPGSTSGQGLHAFAVIGIPQAPTFVYVANRGSDNISAYAMDATAGTLTPLPGSPFSSAVGTPNALAVHPTGKFLYVAPFAGASIEAFSINSSGALTPVPGSPFATDSGAISVAVDPTGRFAYVTNLFADDVSGFTVDENTGALAPIAGSPFPSGSQPHGVTVDPLGRFAYVASCGYGQGCNGVGPGSISEYTIDPVSGSLTAVSDSPVEADQNPMSLTADPTGRFVYVPNPGSGDVSVFTITPGVGSLSQITGSPFPTGTQPFSAAIDPAGHFAFVNSGCCASVTGFNIDVASGTLSVIGTFPAGTVPLSPAVDPSGQFLYVPDALSNDVSGYAINPTTGALTPLGTFPAGTTPIWVAITAPAPPAGPTCSYSISPGGQSFSAAGGMGSFTVNTTPGCGWTLAFSADWINPPFLSPRGGPPQGIGTGTITYIVAPNTGGPRAGSILVGGQTYSIFQAAFICSYAIAPTFASPSDTGGNSSVSVTAPVGCPWTAVSNVVWVTVRSGGSGSGGGVVVLSVAHNTGSARSGTVKIAGSAFSVTQGAGACGALDVTSQVSVWESGLTWVPFSDYQYSQSITVRNNSGSVMPGPLYLVLLGEPTHYGYPDDSLLNGDQLETTCFSSKGDYLMPLPGLRPGQSAEISLGWFRDVFGNIRYTTKVLSGQPSR